MSDTLEELRNFTYQGKSIPAYMYRGIVSYVDDHVIPGDFLQAIISDNLKAAIANADDTNMWLLPVYVMFFYNYTPAACQGSHKAMISWINNASD
jgi:hypothetical protein